MGEGGVEFAPEVVVSQPRYGQALGHGMDMGSEIQARDIIVNIYYRLSSSFSVS